MSDRNQQVVEQEWVSFPGGELEGKRPKAMCSGCRERGQPSQMLCFQCYRAESAGGPREDSESSRAAARASGGGAPRAVGNADRDRALKAKGQLDTASPERFQTALPFEPVNRARLAALKAERVAARVTLREGPGRFEERRRQAQIGARHALLRIDVALEARQLDPTTRQRVMATAVHAAELQLPESWLPFVVAG